MKDKIVSGICHCLALISVAEFPKRPIRNALVFTWPSVLPAKPVITAIIPVREISTANTPSRAVNKLC